MAPSKTSNTISSNSNRNGEAIPHRAIILASCYAVDSSAVLKGLHYSTTGADGLPSPPSSPPLAALTPANKFALTSETNLRRRGKNGGQNNRGEGAAFAIREECERLFCETMKTVFLGERSAADCGSTVMETFHCSSDHDASRVCSWLEIWDYAGGCSFRGFVVGTGPARSLFVFFTDDVVSNDLKAGLMALIELAATSLECCQLVICLDRKNDAEEIRSLIKSLRWVGFDLITLELWATPQTPVSDKWLFLGMEL